MVVFADVAETGGTHSVMGTFVWVHGHTRIYGAVQTVGTAAHECHHRQISFVTGLAGCRYLNLCFERPDDRDKTSSQRSYSFLSLEVTSSHSTVRPRRSLLLRQLIHTTSSLCIAAPPSHN